MDPRHILICFNSDEDYHRVWLREQWYLKKYLMRVFKWTPEFQLDAKSSIAPVWVNFPQLPVHFFAKPSLFSIARTLGSPLTMDATTTFLTRPSVARIYMR